MQQLVKVEEIPSCPHTLALTALDDLHNTITATLITVRTELDDSNNTDAVYHKALEWEQAILTDLAGQILDVYS